MLPYNVRTTVHSSLFDFPMERDFKPDYAEGRTSDYPGIRQILEIIQFLTEIHNKNNQDLMFLVLLNAFFANIGTE